MSAYFDSLIAKAKGARSPEAIANLLRPVLLEMGNEFDAYLETLLASTPAESSTARTLKLIARVWRELAASNRRELQLREFARALAAAEAQQRPQTLLAGLDPNGALVLLDHELIQVLRLLEKRTDGPAAMVAGLRRGIEHYTRMEANLLDWLYGAGESGLGFVKTGPWGAWARQLPAGGAHDLLEALERGESAERFLADGDLDEEAWCEILILLRRIERYLLRSFETRYPNLSERVRTGILTSIFLSFAIFWADFAQALVRRPAFAEASFQSALQILRAFATQDYFPLYGGLFAVFDGPYLRTALAYLSEPLRTGIAPIERAKMLNLLGYTCRHLGEYERSIALHREALEGSAALEEPRVVIANLVNLAATHQRSRQFSEAIDRCERALVYARQYGDGVGEAHALAGLGLARACDLQSREIADPDAYTGARAYLEQGLEQSRRTHTRSAELAALTGLGALELALGASGAAGGHLGEALAVAQAEGDPWWEATVRAALAESLHARNQSEAAVVHAAAAALQLSRLGSADWFECAGLLVVLRGKLDDRFLAALSAAGFTAEALDALDALLEHYRAR